MSSETTGSLVKATGFIQSSQSRNDRLDNRLCNSRYHQSVDGRSKKSNQSKQLSLFEPAKPSNGVIEGCRPAPAGDRRWLVTFVGVEVMRLIETPPQIVASKRRLTA